MFNIFRKKTTESPKIQRKTVSDGPKGQIVTSKIITCPHGFSTRLGGVSDGTFDSLNLGMNRGDNQEKVKENYARFLRACNIGETSFVCGKQVHGDNVYIAMPEDARPAYGYDGNLIEADGYVTNIPNVPLVIFTADCIPLLLYDEKNQVVGAVHCGWRSAVADIEKKAVDKMCVLGAEEDYIKASIGPSIGYCCFEVGEEVIEKVDYLLAGSVNGLYHKKANGKYMLNLAGVLKKRLIQIGLNPYEIEILDECTMCNTDKYWSHRKTGLERGSQASVIML